MNQPAEYMQASAKSRLRLCIVFLLWLLVQFSYFWWTASLIRKLNNDEQSIASSLFIILYGILNLIAFGILSLIMAFRRFLAGTTPASDSWLFFDRKVLRGTLHKLDVAATFFAAVGFFWVVYKLTEGIDIVDMVDKAYSYYRFAS